MSINSVKFIFFKALCFTLSCLAMEDSNLANINYISDFYGVWTGKNHVYKPFFPSCTNTIRTAITDIDFHNGNPLMGGRKFEAMGKCYGKGLPYTRSTIPYTFHFDMRGNFEIIENAQLYVPQFTVSQINCFGYAVNTFKEQLEKLSGKTMFSLVKSVEESIEPILKYFEVTTTPQSGDLAIYVNENMQKVHAGIYKNLGLIPVIESKWGGYSSINPYIFIHDIFFVPQTYGNKVIYYRLKSDYNNSYKFNLFSRV